MVDKEIAPARVTYNKGHVALGTSARNFCWFHPPREAAHCHIRVLTDPGLREEQMGQFEETGIYVRPFQRRLITLKMAPKDIAKHHALILALYRKSEELSRGGAE